MQSKTRSRKRLAWFSCAGRVFDNAFLRAYDNSMATALLLTRIEQAIQNTKPEEQRELLAKLPHLLKLDAADFALLKAAEHSFDFWDNTDDTAYGAL